MPEFAALIDSLRTLYRGPLLPGVELAVVAARRLALQRRVQRGRRERVEQQRIGLGGGRGRDRRVGHELRAARVGGEHAAFESHLRRARAAHGRNGAGKSSLLSLIANRQQVDGGQILRSSNLRVAELAQELPAASEQTIFDWVASGLSQAGELLKQYHHLISEPLDNDDALDRLQKVQTALEAVDGWRLQQQVETVLQRLDLNADAPVVDRVAQVAVGRRDHPHVDADGVLASDAPEAPPLERTEQGRLQGDR